MRHAILYLSTLLALAAYMAFPIAMYASETNGTVSAAFTYAWSNNAGWVNFAPTGGNAHITDAGLTGYVWNDNYGWINLAPTNGGVTNDGEGHLGGFAWGADLGWISFANVSINAAGKFSGTATGSIIGILTFDCTYCDVRTDWRPVSARSTSTPTPSPASGGGTILPPNGSPVSRAPASAPLTPGQNTFPAASPFGVSVSPLPGASPGPSPTSTPALSPEPAKSLNADIDKNGRVDVLDFNLLMVHWDERGGIADINQDGIVDVLDFNQMMVEWSSS